VGPEEQADGRADHVGGAAVGSGVGPGGVGQAVWGGVGWQEPSTLWIAHQLGGAAWAVTEAPVMPRRPVTTTAAATRATSFMR